MAQFLGGVFVQDAVGDHVDHVYLQFLTLMRTDDAREGMLSFMQKRAPEFKGR